MSSLSAPPARVPTWLRALATWLVIFPSVTLGQAVLAWAPPSLPGTARAALLTALVVPFAVWVGVPAVLGLISPRTAGTIHPPSPRAHHVISPDIPGISDTVTTSGLVFVSGQTPGPAQGRSFAEQVDAVFASVSHALDRAGSSMDRLVRLTVYVTDLPERDVSVFRQVRDRWVDVEQPPASSLIGVAALFHPDIAIEIEAVAAPAPRRPEA